MGKVVSAATLYATAYLTEKGRTYLFNKNNVRFDSNGNDLFAIQTFTLSDPDTNYNTSTRLGSGDVPDVAGTSKGVIKATTDYVQTTFSYFTIDVLSFSNPLYSTNAVGDTLTINTDIVFAVNATTDVPPVGTPTIVTGSGSASVPVGITSSAAAATGVGPASSLISAPRG